MIRTERLGRLLIHVVMLLLLALGTAHADSRRDAKRHFQRGMGLIKDGKTDAGVVELERAYRLKPHPNVLFNIARAYDVAGRREQAIAAYERFLGAGPADPTEALARLAVLRDVGTETGPPTTEKPPETATPSPPANPSQALLRAADSWEARARAKETAAPTQRAATTETAPEPATPLQRVVRAAEELAPPQEGDVYERTVISASRTGRSAVFAPASVTVVTDEDIKNSGARTIPDMLRRVAGVDVMAMTATDQNVSIRGFNQRVSNRVLVLVDGRSVYQDFLGATFWSSLTFNLDDVDRIEVIRGPGGALYGANAVVGVINIILKKPGEGPAMGGRVTLGQPNLLETTFRGHGARGPVGLSISAGYTRQRKWALELDRSRRDRALEFTSIPFDLSGEQLRSDGTLVLQPARWLRVTAHLGLVKTIQEIYAIGALRNFYIDGYLGTASLEVEGGPARLRVFYNGLRARVGPQIRPVAERSLVAPVGADVVDAEGTFNAALSFLGEHRAVVGASYRLKSVDWGLLGGQQLQHHAGVFGEETWTGPGGHRVVVSGRVDQHPLVGVVPSARGAFLLKTGRSSAARATMGTAFRTPTFLESYLDATPATPIAGVSIRSVGNRALRPEQNIMVEAGYASEIGDALTVDVAAYYGRLTGLIVQGPLKAPSDDRRFDGETQSYIAGESQFINDSEVFSQAGGEASLTINPLEGVDGYVNYAFLSVLAENEGLKYRQAPKHKLNAGGRLRTPFGLSLSSDAHVVSGAVWAERSFDPNAPGGVRIDRLQVAPYLLVEARAAYRLPGDHVELYVASDNLVGVLPHDTPARLKNTPLAPISPLLLPVSAHREHPFGNPSGARILAGVTAQL